MQKKPKIRVGDRIVVLSGGEVGGREGQDGKVVSVTGYGGDRAYRVEFDKKVFIGNDSNAVQDYDWFKRSQIRPVNAKVTTGEEKIRERSDAITRYRFHLEAQRRLEIAEAAFERAQKRLQEISTVAVHAKRAWDDLRNWLDPKVVQTIVSGSERDILGALAVLPGATLLLRKHTRSGQSARRYKDGVKHRRPKKG